MKNSSIYEQLALLISAIGDETFARTFASIIHKVATSDSLIVFLYSRDKTPEILFERAKHSLRRNSLSSYLEGFYLLDPFYRAAMEESRRGVVRIESIEPPGFRSSEYFCNYYKHSHVEDEVNLIFRISHSSIFAASAQRAEGKGRYKPNEISALVELEPSLRAAAEAHWRWSSPAPADSMDKADHEHFKRVISEFGRTILTAREYEVVQLVLRGFSTAEISRLHNISDDTVKVHRRNIYAKLQISSLSELFGLVVRAIEGDRSICGG